MSAALARVAGGFILSETSDTKPQPVDLFGVSFGNVCRPQAPERFTVCQSGRRLKRLRKNVLTSTRLHTEEMSSGGRRHMTWFVTLTYGDAEWEPLHIAQFLKCLRSWCMRKAIECRYVWVAELQEQRQEQYGGHCMHYHVAVFLPRGYTLPKPDKQGWWAHGHTQVQRVRKSVGYLAKYTSKGTKGELPKGARLHGAGGLSNDSRNELRWWKFPAWLRSVFTAPSDDVIRVPGKGFLSRATGQIVPSIYEVVGMTHSGPILIQVADVIDGRVEFRVPF